MKLYKLTDANDQTYGACQWGENVTHETSGEGELCGPGWTHWTTHPLLAVLLNPIQGAYDLATAHLWEGEGEVGKTDHGLKVGCTRATTIRRVPLPEVPLAAKVRFAIYCAQAVVGDRCPAWSAWAAKWLDGGCRSAANAAAAWAAAAWAGNAAAAEAWAGNAAAAAEEAAAWAAAWAADAAEAAAWAADAAEEAAAAQATANGGLLDLASIAEQAVADEGANGKEKSQ